MITTANQMSWITRNSNKKFLTASQDLLKNISLRLLCNAILSSLSNQSDFPGFTIANFYLNDYLWRPNFPNKDKIKQKTSNQISRIFRKS